MRFLNMQMSWRTTRCPMNRTNALFIIYYVSYAELINKILKNKLTSRYTDPV